MKQPRAAAKPTAAVRRKGDADLPKKPGGGRGRVRSDTPSRAPTRNCARCCRRGRSHFPKRLRQVAIFLWQHPGEVALGTIVQVAEQAGVQPSTLVRFAQIFGYAGFSDLQGIFKDHVKGSWPEGRAATARSASSRHDGNANLHFITASSPHRTRRSAASARISTSKASSG